MSEFRSIFSKILSISLKVEALIGLWVPTLIIAVTIEEYDMYLNAHESEVGLWATVVFKSILAFGFFTVLPFVLSILVAKEKKNQRGYVFVWSLIASIFMLGFPIIWNFPLQLLDQRHQANKSWESNKARDQIAGTGGSID